MRSWPLALLVALGACTVLNSYERVPNGPAPGGGGAGGDEPSGAGGLGGGGDVSGGGGSVPACNEAACGQSSSECRACTCVGAFCDCDPVATGTPCTGGVCLDGACVDCFDNQDCPNGTCDQNTCIEASCADMAQNSGETDVDCGGPSCARCDNGLNCVVDFDCVSLFCSGVMVCAPCVQQADCADPNLYCGDGLCVEKKGLFQACDQDFECISGNCQNGVLCSN